MLYINHCLIYVRVPFVCIAFFAYVFTRYLIYKQKLFVLVYFKKTNFTFSVKILTVVVN